MYFNGTIGEVAYYKSALSGAQAAAQYTAAANSSGSAPMTTVSYTDPGNLFQAVTRSTACPGVAWPTADVVRAAEGRRDYGSPAAEFDTSSNSASGSLTPPGQPTGNS